MIRTLQIVAGLLFVGCDIPTANPNDPVVVDPVDTGASPDENTCADPVVLFYDGDGDGFGDPALSVETCDTPAGHVAQAGDCDDIDPQVHPDAEEVCNQRDDNCDDQIDEGVSESTWYIDGDGDGYGSESDSITACDAPEGYVANTEDCDDANAAVYPLAPDADCDGVDNDCDGSTDEDAEWRTWFLDGDGDGYGREEISVDACSEPEGHVSNADDCDDTNAVVFPFAVDDVCDGIDADCDGSVDEDAEWRSWYIDMDGDGYGRMDVSAHACAELAGHVTIGEDCDDADPAVHPGMTDSTCDDIDNDCDGSLDEDAVGTRWFFDADGDGYGSDEFSTESCLPPEGYVAMSGDCNEESTDIYPGAADVRCDGLDNDCDGAIDEDAETSVWFMDADGDGVGTEFSLMVSCSRPEGHVPTSGDCDESRADVYPGAPDETCDGVDNDCDGSIDEGAEVSTVYWDEDLDGFGTEASSLTTCAPASGYVASAGDCDDTDEMVSPGMDEILDGKDNDCSMVVDDLSLSDADSRFDAAPDLVGFGYALATGHDLTGDGTNDLLIGAHSGSTVALFNGDFTGGDYGPDDAAYTLSTEVSTSRFGSSIDFVTDYNGDGLADIVLGAPELDIGDRLGQGEVSIFLGPLTLESSSATYTYSDSEFESLGATVIDAGQVTGLETSAVAASYSNSSGMDGVVIFDVGPLPPDSKWTLRFLGTGSSDGFGQAMGVADYNGDGFDDMVIGAPSASIISDEDMVAPYGAVYVFEGPFGALETVEDASMTILGADMNGGFGSSLSVAGDWDGDGASDLLVGAPQSVGGEAFVISFDGETTGASVESIMMARLTGPAGELGTSVSLAGDANGDGMADALIGAPSYEEASIEVGAAALFLGGLTGTIDGADAIVTGTAAYQYTGQSVGFLRASGDGLDALAIGAWGHDLDGGGSAELDQGALFIVESAHADGM